MEKHTEQLRRYCKPFLKRKRFRFSDIKGLMERDARQALEVAKAFGDPSGDPERFDKALENAPEGLKRRLGWLLSLTNGANRARRRSVLVSGIPECLAASGVYSEFRRPDSVGYVLARREISGIPAYFILGESPGKGDRSNASGGRIIADQETGKPVSIVIYVNGAGARLAERMDLWLGKAKRTAELDRHLINMDADRLRQHCRSCKIPYDETPVQTLLFITSMRETVRRFNEMLANCGSPEEFMLAALNSQMDSLAAHEAAHLAERKANGSLMMGPDDKELLAYLIEAKYAHPDSAFLSLIHRYSRDNRLLHFVPRLMQDIRARGPAVMLEGEEYLRGIASEMLDSEFLSLTGKLPEDVVDVSDIKMAQTSDFLNQKHLPLLERAIYNPSAIA